MCKRLLLFPAFALILLNCSGTKSEDIASTHGKLAPCPDSPNCVSSQSTDESHHVEPLRYDGSFHEAQERLLSLLRSMDRVKIVTVESDYIHAEFISAFLHFVDDVEFCFDHEKKTIHVRSASRVGYYDLGVNRRRVERIRSRFLEHTRGVHRKIDAR